MNNGEMIRRLDANQTLQFLALALTGSVWQ